MRYSTRRRPRGMGSFERVMAFLNLRPEIHDNVSWNRWKALVVKFRNNSKRTLATVE